MSHNNYNKMFSNKQQISRNEIVSHEHRINIQNNIIKANVQNCDKLRLRKDPSADADVLCLIDKSDAFNVYLENSVDNFYKVVTSDGVEGYCMKEYVKLSEGN